MGNSAKTGFESIVFLFITHPFDVGDRVQVDGDTFIVRRMHVLTTMFRTSAGASLYVSNSILANKQIINFRRSQDMTDIFPLDLPFGTPSSTILEFRSRVQNFLKVNSNEFTSKGDVLVMGLDGVDKIKLSISAQHRGNWQDSSYRYERKIKFMLFIKDTLDELGVRHSLLEKPKP